ncbi:endonuclease III [Phycisphaera mikurensis]|uniref:Endonuclease III n=1 Tax=Phycisphaera mikurensis (strain NBRC 102666 / KCTC 22515 / FYK2301M01) TaxID=1142394 RepID=I0IH63_PHYMF|nr:endonuclease III [Phycisphaera mikurensis]MBB6440853.1 endonuclease-3 [Phycisphaera mikurensis]BAM04601.1 DNA glycosylase/DNA-(apurinic or apyrimidinic site) lyase [Phycisphaera mikurensis NBRC 102666]
MADRGLRATAQPAKDRARARRLYAKLRAAYPDARCDLLHDSPFQLLVATILSAQCTDAAVNRATPALFARFPDPAAMAAAEPTDVEPFVKTCGFFRAKARNLVAAARVVEKEFGGRVPETMDGLLRVPGAARKTANVVLGNAFGKPAGVTVDTHVGRISVRLGLVEADPKNAIAIERDLAGLLPKKDWTHFSHVLIWHGRATCRAQKPRCGDCVVRRSCPRIGLVA